MSTAPAETDGPALPPLPLPGATPREIRAALHPEYRDDFERDYQAALAEAGRSLDLAGIHETIEHWRRRSWITRDKLEHRRVVRRAVELLTGHEPPGDEPVAVTEARLQHRVYTVETEARRSIPESYLKREAEHVEGVSPELAVVTHAGGK